jgi:adenylosuccinate synthase
MYKAYIIIGLGFGDEGKGLVTDYFCRRFSNSLVIRFNGGQQAGHTVVTKTNKRHVFSSFGSGTLRGTTTYISNFCTISPTALLREYQELEIQPRLLIDRLCPVTTHYDVLYNQITEDERGGARHGSCGAGFGATIARHELTPLKLYAQDLLFPEICAYKLNTIRSYYEAKIRQETKADFDLFDHDAEDLQFIKNIKKIIDLSNQSIFQFVNEQDIFLSHNIWDTLIFEGAQGVLLDMDFGNFPHVTRSNTTSKNAIKLLNRYLNGKIEIEIVYVTRCYQTRHGAGPFPERLSPKLINNESETNVYNEYQGDFRINILNINLLNYALSCDSNFSLAFKKHIVITCLDQLETDQLECYHNNSVIKLHYKDLPTLLDFSFETHRFSFSNCSEDLL